MTREAHLVGSLPGDTPAAAMRTALEILGPFLRSLPDGETGERRNWVISIVESLRDHPALTLVKDGGWTDYDDLPQLRVKHGRTLYGASLDFGHVAATRTSHPQFVALQQELGREDLAFQQGVPGDFDLAMFTFGPAGALRHKRAFTEATLHEIGGVSEVTGPGTLFQIEVPAELVLLAKAPDRAQPALAKVLARSVTNLARESVPGARFAVHLCLGDMNNKAFGTMRDVRPLVLLSNEITAHWPREHELAVVHAPFAAADDPATTDPAFYAPLADLDLPAGTGFAAGFAHEAQSLQDQRTIRERIEGLLGREVMVAAACGLGRRSFADAEAVLRRTAELCAD